MTVQADLILFLLRTVESTRGDSADYTNSIAVITYILEPVWYDFFSWTLCSLPQGAQCGDFTFAYRPLADSQFPANFSFGTSQPKNLLDDEAFRLVEAYQCFQHGIASLLLVSGGVEEIEATRACAPLLVILEICADATEGKTPFLTVSGQSTRQHTGAYKRGKWHSTAGIEN